MKRFFSSVLLTLVAFIGAVGLFNSSVKAQDDMTAHVCDSTLIALLYVAEYHYGFHSMEMDLATFEKGQFAPLFDAMMSMMEDEMMATEEPMMEDMMATEEAMMDDEMMVMLAPAQIPGEDPACTGLRAELDAFLLTALKDDMMMEEGQ
jgi:hypothetical protein